MPRPQRALSPLPLRGSALLPGGDGAERAAEINKACGELYAFVRSGEHGGAEHDMLGHALRSAFRVPTCLRLHLSLTYSAHSPTRSPPHPPTPPLTHLPTPSPTHPHPPPHPPTHPLTPPVEDGAASDMFLEFFQGGALAGDLLENATPDTADAIATLVKSIGEDSAAFCHYLCSHGAVPALVRLCGPEFR